MDDNNTGNMNAYPPESGANASTPGHESASGPAFGPGGADSTSATSPGTPPPYNGGAQATSVFDRLRSSGWHRSSNRIAGGVCAGLAEKWGIDPIIVRGVALLLMLPFGLAMLAYGLAWLFLPAADDGRIPAEDIKNGNMQGLYVLPIALGLLGILRTFSGLGEGFGLFGLLPFASGWEFMRDDGFFSLMDSGIAQSLLFSGLFFVGIAIIVWISYLIARHRYSDAWKHAGVIALLLFAVEVFFIVSALGLGMGIISAVMLAMMTAFALPLASIIWLIVWLVTRGSNTTPSPSGYYSNAGFGTGFNQTAPEATAGQPFAGQPYSTQSGTVPPQPVQAEAAPGAGDKPENTAQAGYPAAMAAATSPVVTGIDAQTQGAPEKPATPQPQPGATPFATASTPGFDPSARPLAPTKPRIAGPSLAFSLGLLGLLVLMNVGALAAFLLGMHPWRAILLDLGGMSVLMGLAGVVLALRRRRQGWVPWVAGLLTFSLTLPALGMASFMNSETGRRLYHEVPRNWHQMVRLFEEHQYDVKPGQKLNLLTGSATIDLRHYSKAAEAIEITILNGGVDVVLSPSQPVEIQVQRRACDLHVSTNSQWQQSAGNEPEVFASSNIDTDRPQYFDAAGEKVTFTDYDTSLLEDDSANSSTVTIRNEAATKAKSADIQVIKLQVSSQVNIYERPKEALWNGTVLPSGQFLVNYWLDQNSRENYDPTSYPAALRKRAVDPDATLGGRPVSEYAEEYGVGKVPLSKFQASTDWVDANGDGFNDNYQVGGKLWREDDDAFNDSDTAATFPSVLEDDSDARGPQDGPGPGEGGGGQQVNPGVSPQLPGPNTEERDLSKRPGSRNQMNPNDQNG